MKQTKMRTRVLSMLLVIIFTITGIKVSPVPAKAADLPKGFLDLSQGLSSDTNYGGIYTLEDMKAGLKEGAEFQNGSESVMLDTFVQGSSKVVLRNQIPVSGAALKVAPFHSGVFTIAYELENRKTFRFVDSDGNIVEEYQNISGNTEYICKSYEVLPGTTYYAYESDGILSVAGLSLKYDEFLNLSQGLFEGKTYGEFAVLENMTMKSSDATTFTAKESGNTYTFSNYVSGTNNVVTDGPVPQSGAAIAITPVKAGKLVIALKLGSGKTFRFTDAGHMYTEYKNPGPDSQLICHEYDVEPGVTYYAYGLGTKISVYGLGLIYEDEIDLSEGLLTEKDYGGIKVWDDMKPLAPEGTFTFTDEITGEIYTYDAFVQGSVNPVLSGFVPTSGAVVAVRPTADGTFRIAFRLNNGKKFYFIDDDGSIPRAVVERSNTTGAAQHLCYTFDVKAGHTYYAYGTGTKIPIAAMELKYTSAIQELDKEVVIPDPVPDVAKKAIASYDMDSIVDGMNMNANGNNASIVNRAGVGNVLKLGALNTEVRKAGGVEILNPFAGRTDLRQTLGTALRNNGVMYNGTIADENELKQLTPTYREGRTYPFPVYTNGLTVSTWVRIPENVTADTVLFAFTHEEDIVRGVGAVRLTAGGNILFSEGTKAQTESSANNYQLNSYLFNYKDADLTGRAGEWVYVSMTIENDKIGVYIDGLEAEGKVEQGYAYGQYGSKNFNKGFGYRGAHAAMVVANPAEAYKNYRDLLINFSDEERAKGDFSDFDKYHFLNSDSMLLVDFITDNTTLFWLGGDDGDALWDGAAAFSASAEGMMYDNLMFFETALTPGELYGLYLDEGPKNDTEDETPVEDGDKDDEDEKVTHEPHSLVYTVDFDDPAAAEDPELGVMDFHADVNHSLLESVDGRGSVLKTGKLAEDAEMPLGVEIKNPFAGMDQYDEDFVAALERNGVMFNGTTADLDDQDNLVPREGMTFPFPEWENGFTVSLWARMLQYATEDTPLLTFTRRNVKSGIGALAIMAGGEARYFNSDNSLNDKRNAFYFDYDGEDLLKNAGSWVLVTITLENDMISIYYNGKQATGTAHARMNYLNTSVKFFNYGFGYRGAMEELAATDITEAYANFRDLLDAFSEEEKQAADWSDFSKYTFLNCGREHLIGFLTDEDTKLYIGGDFGTEMTTVGGSNQYTDASAGLRIDDIRFYNYVLSDDEVEALYDMTRVEDVPLEDEKPEETPEPTDSPEPSESAEPTDSPEPSASTEPTDSPEPSEPAEPTDSPEPSESAEPADSPEPTESAEPTDPPELIEFGNINDSEAIDAEDALLVLKHAAQLETLTEEQIKAADVDGSGIVDAEDALLILQYAAQIIDSFPVEKKEIEPTEVAAEEAAFFVEIKSLWKKLWD